MGTHCRLPKAGCSGQVPFASRLFKSSFLSREHQQRFPHGNLQGQRRRVWSRLVFRGRAAKMTFWSPFRNWSVVLVTRRQSIKHKTTLSGIASIVGSWRSFSDRVDHPKPWGGDAAFSPGRGAALGVASTVATGLWWSFFSPFGRVRGREYCLRGVGEGRFRPCSLRQGQLWRVAGRAQAPGSIFKDPALGEPRSGVRFPWGPHRDRLPARMCFTSKGSPL